MEGWNPMNLSREISKHVERLPRSEQEQVLRFVTGLASALPVGGKGSDLAAFAGTLDPESAREMTDAIEKECERVDTGQW